MKTARCFPFVVALSALAGLPSGCSKVESSPSIAQDTESTGGNLVADTNADVCNAWDNIKDYAFERRDDFAATLDRLAAKREAELQRINVRFAGLPTGSDRDRDRAIKRYNDARASLLTSLVRLRTSTAATWVDAKRQTTESLQRLQAAYDEGE